MLPSGEEVKTFLAVFAAAISMVSLFWARRSWLQSNRPIVTAYIEDDTSGVGVATFNLVVANSGNRPATRVRLHAKAKAIAALVDAKASPDEKAGIAQCFAPASMIPVLRNGESLTTAFGAFVDQRQGVPCLKYEAEIEIEARYCDLEGRKYRSRMPLKVYPRNGFAGSIWAPPTKWPPSV